MSLHAALPAALAECRLHAEVLAEALSDLSPAAFTAEDVARLASDQRRVLDQLAYRFGKLQDSMGEKVLPAVLDLVQEPLPPWRHVCREAATPGAARRTRQRS